MHLTRLLKGWHMLLLCAPFSAFSQDIQWEKSFGGRHADYLSDAVSTADYGFILAGSSLSDKTGNKTSSHNGNLDYWVWKMDEKGEPVWQKSFGGSGIDLLQSVKLTNDGGFLLAGSSNSPKGEYKKEGSKGDMDFWVIKLDAGGGEKWQRTIGGSSADQLATATQTKDGGFILGGTSYSDNDGDKSDKSRGNSDYWIVKLDAEGNIKWQKTYGGQYSDELRSIALTQDGGYLIGGSSNSNESGDKKSKCLGSGDFWILKLDKDGNVEWQQTYGGEKDDQLNSVLQLADGNYLIGGNSASGAGLRKHSSSRNGSDFWLIKIDRDGNSIWQENYDYGKYDILTSLIENPDQTILIGGYSKSEVIYGKDNEGTNDFIALKVDAQGQKKWDRTIGSDGDDVLKKLIQTRDGGYLLAGTSNPESIKSAKKRARGDKILKKMGNGKQAAIAQRTQENIDGTINDARNSVNSYYKEQTSAATNTANETAQRYNDSPMKMEIGAPADLLSPSSGKKSPQQDKDNAGNPKKIPSSRQKSNNLGGNDFWVVKLKDKDKKEKKRNVIEAFPNPAADYTNVIVGYEYSKGKATIYDLSGRQLRQFSISEQTVPVNLEGLPEGIYLVNIRTDKSDDSIKIIKARNKN